VVRSAGFRVSMSRKGDCYDNTPMESFFHTLKTALVHHRHYQTRAEATHDIFAYIEGFYNRTRRQPAIDYVRPIEMELKKPCPFFGGRSQKVFHGCQTPASARPKDCNSRQVRRLSPNCASETGLRCCPSSLDLFQMSDVAA
jgi:transposase InsO family protein